MNNQDEIEALKKRIEALEIELEAAKSRHPMSSSTPSTVHVPESMKPIFDQAQKIVGEYFNELWFKPEEGSIQIEDERYVLVRASSLSIDFFQKIIDLYVDRGQHEAINIGRNFLFDISHVLGIEDAKNFHKKLNLNDPISKLSAGPVHFAYSGWAFVDILPESKPSPDENYFIKYHHPYSFEADSWLKANKKSAFPVCIMNAGYSSGWCEQSFGIPLTSVEISCRAKGDQCCTFIMAPPHKIHEYLTEEQKKEASPVSYDVPVFFERKKTEEQIKASLFEKEVLLKEIHHRVKNNLQIISSLLKLQSSITDDVKLNAILKSSQQRIKTMAIVHEKLYESDLQYVNISSYIRSIAQMAYESFSMEDKNIDFKFNFVNDLIFFKIDKAIPCGLIVNEIITNAFKYAFAHTKNGWIEIGLHKTSSVLSITIADNGIGLPKEAGPGVSKSLGFELITVLSEQIDAQIEIVRQPGTTFVINIPIE